MMSSTVQIWFRNKGVDLLTNRTKKLTQKPKTNIAKKLYIYGNIRYPLIQRHSSYHKSGLREHIMIELLKHRFLENIARHPNLDWAVVEKYLRNKSML